MTRHLIALTVLLYGCRATARIDRSEPAVELVPLDTLVLSTPATGMCRDGDGLVLLDAGGERLVRLSARLEPLETIPLTRRLVGPRGVKTDRFYYYVWSGDMIWRMLREKLVLQSWLGNVRVAGMASFAPGEMLVSDADRNVVWYKALFGESRKFLAESDVSRPGALATLPGARFCVISGRDRLVSFNRSGVKTGATAMPDGCDLLDADEAGGLCVAQAGVSNVWLLSDGRFTRFSLPGCSGPVELAFVAGMLAVLDAGTRVATFALPRGQPAP